MAFFLSTFSVKAQTPVVFEEWAESKGVQEFFYKNVTVTDGSNNVYVAGATLNGDGNYDLLISKFDRHGVHLWSDTIAGAGEGHDMAAAITIDTEGDILVCGTISEGGSAGNNMLLVKYDTDGFEYWRYSHDNAANEDAAVALCIDSNNDVYLTGGTYNSTALSDMLTIKVDSSGDLVWDETYDYNSLYDLGVKIAVSGSRVVVTGGGQYNFNSFVIVALSYMQSDGSLSGSANIGGTQQTMEEVSDLFVDENNNVYIVGSKMNSGYGYDFKTIKLDEDLDVVWVKEWDGDGLNDYARGVKVAPNGDVYVCGTSKTTDDGDDIVLISYSSAGNINWIKTYNGNYRGDDRAETLEYHPDGYIYVAGSSFVVSNMDYLTLKYNTSGDLLWEINYNSPYNKNDRATNMAIDSDGDIIVTGQCERDSVLKTYYAVKYVEYSLKIQNLDNILGVKEFTVEKNSGQVLYSDNTISNDIIYLNHRGLIPHCLMNDKIIMNKWSSPNDSTVSDSAVRVDIKFNKFNENLKVYGVELSEFYSNYYLGNINHYIERNPHFKYTIYPNIYSNIDLVVHTDSLGEINFTLICPPEAELSTFEFELDGNMGLTTNNNGDTLNILTELGDVLFGPIEAFHIETPGILAPIGINPQWDVLGSNKFRINATVNDSLTLITFKTLSTPPISIECEPIDFYQNNLIWSTYFSSNALEHTESMSISDEGELFVSITYGNEQQLIIPIDPGVFVVPNQLESQSFLIQRIVQLYKFNPNNTLAWVSYYGGTTTIYDQENTQYIPAITANCKIAHFSDELYFHGHTNTTNLPVVNAFMPVFPQSGPDDESTFFGKLNSDGYLLWSTYYGFDEGSYTEIVGIDFDQSSNRLFFIGEHIRGYPNSLPPLNIYLTNAYNEGFDDPINEELGYAGGFIGLIDQDYQLKWVTTFNGVDMTGMTDIMDLKIVEDRILICGSTTCYTTNESMPIQSPSEHFPVGGDSGDLVIGDNFQLNNAVNAFVAEFDLTSLKLLWSTLLDGDGSSAAVSCDGFKLDHDYVYAIGVHTNNQNLEAFATNQTGYFQGSNWNIGGSYNAIALFKFLNRTVDWSSFYGGERDEFLTDLKLMENSNLIIGGYITDATSIETCTEYPPNYFPICPNNYDWFYDESYNNDVAISSLTNYMSDGFLTSFNENNDLIWSTYFGGCGFSSNPESVIRIVEDNQSNSIYVLGQTPGSEDFPVVYSPNAYNQNNYFSSSNLIKTNTFISKFALDYTPIITNTQNNDDVLVAADITCYPNPGGNTVTLISSERISALAVYDVCGKSQKVYPTQNGEKFIINTGILRSGMYYFKVVTENETRTLKWIKQ